MEGESGSDVPGNVDSVSSMILVPADLLDIQMDYNNHGAVEHFKIDIALKIRQWDLFARARFHRTPCPAHVEVMQSHVW